MGEGDITIMELLGALNNSWLDNLHTVPGLIVKTQNGEIQSNATRELVKDIDTLPIPNYEVFDSFPQVTDCFYNLLTSRGCPFECVFCASKVIWRRKWRYRSLKNIAMELLEVRNKYGVRRIHIVDDNFCLEKGRAAKILNLLSSHGFEISLTNSIRADTVDEELVKILKKNKVSPVVVGVENADQDTFKYVAKGESLKTIEYALRLLRANGISVIATMVIGLINTTSASTTRSIKFLRGLKVSGHWTIAVPFPGTSLYRWVSENGKFLYDYNRFVADGIPQCMVGPQPPVLFETPEYRAMQRLEDYRRANFMTGNYYFLFNESESILRIIVRLIRLTIKYDIKRIGIHIISMTKLACQLLLSRCKKRKSGEPSLE